MQIPFHAFISRNKDFGIMLPRFYLKYAVFEFKMSNWVKSDPPILTGFEVSISKNKKSGQLCNYQNIWKIALSNLCYGI